MFKRSFKKRGSLARRKKTGIKKKRGAKRIRKYGNSRGGIRL